MDDSWEFPLACKSGVDGLLCMGLGQPKHARPLEFDVGRAPMKPNAQAFESSGSSKGSRRKNKAKMKDPTPPKAHVSP